MKALPLFSIAYLDKFLLKLPIYKHHHFAVVIIFIGAFSILILHTIVQPINGNIQDSILLIVIFSVVKLLVGAKELLDTYILQGKYLSQFLLLFYHGISGFLLCLLFSLGASNIKCETFQKIEHCEEGKNIENYANFLNIIYDKLTMIVLLLISTLTLNVCRMQTKFYLSAMHRVLSCISTSIIN